MKPPPTPPKGGEHELARANYALYIVHYESAPPKGGEKRESLTPSPSPGRGEPENEDLLDAV